MILPRKKDSMCEVIDGILESYKDDMIDSLRKLLQIQSVAEESGDDGFPFGKGVQEALEFVLQLGREHGLSCVNYDNYAGELTFGGKPQSIGVVSHLDVVPAGSDWEIDPYGGHLVDDRIYGRGAIDNKGPLIAAFYACCAIKDSNLPLRRNIKHILGTDEESGRFFGIEYYKKHTILPCCGIVPDSWFPACYAEKGFYNFVFKRNIVDSPLSGIVLEKLEGGEAYNIVAAEAHAEFVVDSVGGLLLEKMYGMHKHDGLRMVKHADRITILAIGKAAHASTPELGQNAIANLLQFLESFYFTPSDLCASLHAMSRQTGYDCDGKGMELACSDETGNLTNNLGMVSYEATQLLFKMNLRAPVSVESAVIEEKLQRAAKTAGMDYLLTHYSPPFYMDPDSGIMQTLIESYQSYTKDFSSLPRAHGGGSYARILSDFVPFGPLIEGEELSFHMKNENISSDRLLLLSKIYAQALYKLATM